MRNSFINQSRIPKVVPCNDTKVFAPDHADLRQHCGKSSISRTAVSWFCAVKCLSGPAWLQQTGLPTPSCAGDRAELTRKKYAKYGHCNNNIRMSTEQSVTTLAAQQPRVMAEKGRFSCRTTHQCTASTTRHQHEQLPRASQTSTRSNTPHTHTQKTTHHSRNVSQHAHVAAARGSHCETPSTPSTTQTDACEKATRCTEPSGHGCAQPQPTHVSCQRLFAWAHSRENLQK